MRLCPQVVDAVQPQRMVRAVQLECRCLQHECSRQAAAIQLLEAAADRRRMQERRLEHDFWEVAREALGEHLQLRFTAMLLSGHRLQCSFAVIQQVIQQNKLNGNGWSLHLQD